MTCVTALKWSGAVFMGTDDRISHGGMSIATKHKYILDFSLPNGDTILFGISGMGNTITAELNDMIPNMDMMDPKLFRRPAYDLEDLENEARRDRWMDEYVRELCVSLRDHFTNPQFWGMWKDENGPCWDGNLLFAWRDRLWWIGSDLMPQEIERHISMGAGAHVAMGATEALLMHPPINSPTELVQRAIAISSKFMPFIGQCTTVKRT